MLPRLSLPLCAVALFCLTSMAGCPNNVPAGQLTVVQGHVINLRTGRPLPGVCVALLSDDSSLRRYYQLEDSVLTDRQGAYALSFTNKKGLYYAVSCERSDTYRYQQDYRLDFADSTYNTPYSGQITRNLRTGELTLGQRNTFKFRASPRRVFRVRVVTRTTGYEQLLLDNGAAPRPADNQQFTVLLYQSPLVFARTSQEFTQQPGIPMGITFRRQPNAATLQDTLVRVVPTSPLAGDTVEATLRFGR